MKKIVRAKKNYEQLIRHILPTLQIIAIFALHGCNREPEPDPIPVTITWSQEPTFAIRSSTSAVLSATLTQAPTGQAVTTGFVWSKTNTMPTLTDSKTSRAATIVTLPHVVRDSLPNLAINETYFARAYLTTKTGTTYSPPVTFQLKVSVTDLFAQTLTGLLQNSDTGYGFVLYEGDEMKASDAGGFKARAVETDGPKPYTIDTKMHIASMSKTVAAMAFLQLAAQKASEQPTGLHLTCHRPGKKAKI